MPLSKRASLQAQRMMREAFMELERVITVSDRAQLKNLSLKDVQQAALQIEKQLAASQSLRNMRRLVPLFTGLGHYSQAIEVLCNGTPYLPWLWTPIKLVLKISADYIEAFEQIIKVYSRLAEPLARFNLFDRAYSNNIEVQNTLAVYYSDILKFHGEAYKFVRRNAWQRLFATSWGRFQRRFDNIFDDLKAHEDLVDKTVNAANLSEAKEMREKLEDWRQQEMAKLKTEEEERTSTEFRAILSVLKVDETHQIKVFDNLISEANQNPGSCSWILQQPKIRSWAKCESDAQFVVLHGFVGSGKSVLAAQIATFLRASESSLVAAHFCTYLYPESTDYNYIMRSLMIQIIRLDPELITLSYDWLVLKKKAPSNTVVEQLLRLLVEAMGALPEKQKTLHIIIDGLDECDDSTIASVVKIFNKLIASASSSTATLLKVLLCTQMKPGVAKFVKKKHQVSLSSEKDHLNKAIQDYTLQRINAIRPSLSQLHITDDDVTALASQITQKADGMFLWAKLVMKYINKNLFYHRDEILKAAISLPQKLGEFYGRMLSQIMANFDERSSQRISAVLSWIAFAKRPLRLAELLSALAFDTKHEQVDALVPAYILDRCEPLIQKQADSSYSFVHVSVRDFLQSSDTTLLITENESQRRHGLATVRCLLSSQQIFAPLYPDSERTLRVLRGLHGFHMYATEYWVDYLLASLEFDQAQFFESDFFALSCRLAQNFIAAEPDCEGADGSLSNPRLTLIRQKDYCLFKMVKIVLLEQNKETIEQPSIHGDTTQQDDTAGDVIALKKKYQTTIQKLLNYSNYPGISFHQLEQFKQNFRISAFTCRVWSCPYATLGFNNVDSLIRHEADHSKHICRAQGCQYPVFASARSLKNHVAEHHTSPDQRLKRRSIRKRPALVGSSGPVHATNYEAGGIGQPEPYNLYKSKEDSQRIDLATRQAKASEEAEELRLTSGHNSRGPYNISNIFKDANGVEYPWPHDDASRVPNMDLFQAVPSQMHSANDAIQDGASPNWDAFSSPISRTSSLVAVDGWGVWPPDPSSPEPTAQLLETTAFSNVFTQHISAANSQHLDTIQNSPSSSTSRDASPHYNPTFAVNPSSEPGLETDASRMIADLTVVRNSPSSSTSRDASPFRQSSPLAPLPPHNLASQPQILDQERKSPFFYKDRRGTDIQMTWTQAEEQQWYKTWTQAEAQQWYKTRYTPTPTPTGPSTTQDNSLPLPIPPHLRVGGPRPLPPPPPTPLTLPVKAAGLQSTPPGLTFANKTPYSYRQALHTGSSATVLPPYATIEASSFQPTLPPIGPDDGPRLRTCNICSILEIECNGTNPCRNCVSKGHSCSYHP